MRVFLQKEKKRKVNASYTSLILPIIQVFYEQHFNKPNHLQKET